MPAVKEFLTKCCTKCGKTKSVTGFGKRAAYKNGLFCWCKSCAKIHNQAYQQLPTRRAYQQAYRQSHKLESKKYRHSNKIKMAEYQKEYRLSHKIEAKKYRKEYYQKIEGYLRHIFSSMKQRCNCTNAINYEQYGAKGVKCLFSSFDEFYHHITIGLRYDTYQKIKGKKIHRINNRNYEVENIEFLTPKEHGAKHRELNRKEIDK